MKKTLLLILYLTQVSFILGAAFENKIKIDDLDGDHMREVCKYTLVSSKRGYTGRLRVLSGKKVIWNHQWFMQKRDLKNLVSEDSDKLTTKEWVGRIFVSQHGVSVSNQKISSKDIQLDQLEFAGKKYKIPTYSIESEIIENSKPIIITYRAEWDEDVMNILYLNSIKKFICFRRGID